MRFSFTRILLVFRFTFRPKVPLGVRVPPFEYHCSSVARKQKGPPAAGESTNLCVCVCVCRTGPSRAPTTSPWSTRCGGGRTRTTPWGRSTPTPRASGPARRPRPFRPRPPQRPRSAWRPATPWTQRRSWAAGPWAPVLRWADRAGLFKDRFSWARHFFSSK